VSLSGRTLTGSSSGEGTTSPLCPPACSPAYPGPGLAGSTRGIAAVLVAKESSKPKEGGISTRDREVAGEAYEHNTAGVTDQC